MNEFDHPYNDFEPYQKDEQAPLIPKATRRLNNRRNNDKEQSFVIHIGFIHQSAQDIEILSLVAPFGRFANFLYLKQKNQAMVEFEEFESAKRMQEYSKSHQLKIRGKPVSIMFSRHQHLTTRENSKEDFFKMFDSFRLDRSKKVLHAVLEDIFYRVTFEDFEYLFLKYADIKRLVVFKKRDRTQALVEMPDIETAIMTKLALDGQRMFSDSGFLNVTFSKSSELKINPSDKNCKDYTVPEPLHEYNDQHVHTRQRERSPLQISSYDSRERRLSPPPRIIRDTSRLSRYDEYNMGQMRDYRNVETHGPVILVSNLPTHLSCNDIFNFVGYFGDIRRIKILYKKRDTAMIQMMDEKMAETVVNHLHQVPFDGSMLHIIFSNYDYINMPSDSAENPQLTQDYSDSKLHRYKRPGSKNYKHIYPPSNVLHVSNLSHDMPIEDVKEIFAKIASITVNRVESLRNIKGQVFVITNSITDAIYGIMRLHNYILPNSTELKVSFSKGSDSPSFSRINHSREESYRR